MSGSAIPVAGGQSFDLSAGPKPLPIDSVSATEIRENLPEASWDTYVAGRPDASAYHYAGWPRLIGHAFGHEVRMVAACSPSGVSGVLPLIVMRSRLFGRHLVSLPFLNAGGVLADTGDTVNQLVSFASDLARDVGAKYLELRHRERRCPSLRERSHKVGMALRLKNTVDEQWSALDRKVRNQVRKAEKSGLSTSSGGAELVEPFYDVFSRNMRDLGTPVFPRRLFDDVLRTFPANTTVFCVHHGQQPVAGAVMHHRGDWLEVIWASALRDFNPMCANVLLYWSMMQRAIEAGVRTFEFGRCTPHEGTFHFKRQWGAEPYPLVWEYWPADRPLAFDASATNPRYARAIGVWRRLPLGVTAALGPRIVRGIPC
jgi:FemAB-related protein (PEP-CTERM system-associated)